MFYHSEILPDYNICSCLTAKTFIDQDERSYYGTIHHDHGYVLPLTLPVYFYYYHRHRHRYLRLEVDPMYLILLRYG